ncbi:hypothetical protein ES868_12450 [Salmonella enterica]|nr:hypothetical protein [Salmonella enterica]ECE6272454.1 hypothetical protein [Salmonella enterica subsp. diarizonae]EAP9279376.1 hypothetical protein [Salmonella enterica]EAT1871774.1 hypothetical protein [Salmonella enterica]EBH4923112.1 hypothetical protein [Salmonella enterica]
MGVNACSGLCVLFCSRDTPTIHRIFCSRRKKAHPSGWASSLFDAWQFMAGVLPATLRAVAAQRSNPLPADLSSSGERSPTDYR